MSLHLNTFLVVSTTAANLSKLYSSYSKDQTLTFQFIAQKIFEPNRSISQLLSIGTYGYFLTKGFDSVLKYFLLPSNVKQMPSSFLDHVVLFPIAEELVYAYVLQTSPVPSQKYLSPLLTTTRFVFSLVLGKTAVRHFCNQNQASVIGLIWAVTREIFLRYLPDAYKVLVLNGVDSLIFALNETNFETIKIATHKILSATFFRAVANLIRVRYDSLLPAISQHILFNLSCTVS